MIIKKMAARKPKVTVDWIVSTTTDLGSEAGADPMGVHICRISQQCMCRKYFTWSKFTDISLILMRSQIFMVVS